MIRSQEKEPRHGLLESDNPGSRIISYALRNCPPVASHAIVRNPNRKLACIRAKAGWRCFLDEELKYYTSSQRAQRSRPPIANLKLIGAFDSLEKNVRRRM